MSKVYTFIELLSEIKEGKIKSGTKFKEIHLQDYKIKIKDGLVYDINGYCISLNINEIFEMKFQLIEEDTIDIQNIKEIINDGSINNTYEIKMTINELIKALKQLDKKIKENMQ